MPEPPELPRFDPDVSPKNEVNRAAAAARGLRYDETTQSYVDEDGFLILDAFGQPL